MSTIVSRRHRYVQEFIDHMNERLEDSKGDIDAILGNLTHDESDTIDLELARCFSRKPTNVRYYLENYHIINTAGEGKPPQLQTIYPFRDSQEILWEDFEKCWALQIPVKWILLKARRAGWSTLIGAIIFNRTISIPLTNSLILADEKVRSEFIFDMSRLAYDYLPYWMRPEVSNEIKGSELRFDRFDKKERRSNPGLHSCLYVDAANKPTGAGRGMGFEHLHATEVSRYNNSSILTSDLLPTLPESNPLSIQCMEGTAEGREYFYHRMWKASVQGKTEWRPIFTGWWKEKRYSRPFASLANKETFQFTEDEQALVAKVKDEFSFDLSKEQLNWRRKKQAEFEASEEDADKIEQEYPSYPESAWRVGGHSFFPKRELSLIEKMYVRAPLWFGELQAVKKGPKGEEERHWVTYKAMEEAPLWIWEWAKAGSTYYLGADPGHGVPGKDSSAISVWRSPQHASQPFVQVAEFKGFVGGINFSKMIDMLGRYYNTCEIAPECNTITEVIANLLNIHEYPKIYRWQRPDKIKGRFTNYFGWETNVKSRHNLISQFRTFILQGLVVIKSSRLVDECFTFVDDGTGKYAAAEDSHDDCLFAAMIACYCLLKQDPTLVERQVVKEEKSNLDYQNSDYSPEYDEPKNSTQNTEFALL